MSRRSREEVQKALTEGERLIKEEGMSDTKAAEAVGVSQGTMSRYMRDRRKGGTKKATSKKKYTKYKKKSLNPTITEIEPMKVSSGKTLLIISEDSELIKSLIERYY